MIYHDAAILKASIISLSETAGRGKDTMTQSEIVRDNQSWSEIIRDSQSKSEIIRVGQNKSEIIRVGLGLVVIT